MLAQEVIADDERGHGLDHRDGAGQDAGIVTAPSGEFGGLAGDGDGLLRFGNRSGRFESDAEEDMFAVADAALDAAGAVGEGLHASFLDHEGVVVFASGEARPGKAAANFKSLCRGQAHHGLGQIGFQFVKDRLAQRMRNSTDDAFDRAADAVALGADFLDAVDHFLRGGGIGAAHRGRIDIGGRYRFGINLGIDVVDRTDIGDDFEFGMEGADDFLGDDSGGDAADGFAGGGAASTFPVPDAIFGLIGKIGVRGAEHGFHLGVGRGAGILVIDGDQDRGAEGLAAENAGKDATLVLFLTGGDDVALARAATVELNLNLFGGDGKARRTAVDDAANAAAVRFAPGGNAKECAKDARHRE